MVLAYITESIPTAAILIPIVLTAIIVALVTTRIQFRKKQMAELRGGFGNLPTGTDYELGSINQYSEYIKSHATYDFRVDSITWNDLDMDDIFKRINNCITSVGEEYLYNCLHELKQEDDELLEREKLISLFTDDAKARLKTQICLLGLGKESYNGLTSIIFKTDFHILGYPIMYTILACMPILAALYQLAI